MLSLTEEEWAVLHTYPAAQRLFEQMRRYVDDTSRDLANGLALNPDPHVLANSYTYMVGGIAVLNDILEYQPPRGEDEDG